MDLLLLFFFFCISCVKHSESRVYTWSSVNISTGGASLPRKIQLMEAILTESKKKDLCCLSHSQVPCHQIKAREALIIQWSFLPITRIIKTQSRDGLGFVLFTSSFWGHLWECGCSQDTIHLLAQMLVKGNTSLRLSEILGCYCGLKNYYKQRSHLLAYFKEGSLETLHHTEWFC